MHLVSPWPPIYQAWNYARFLLPVFAGHLPLLDLIPTDIGCSNNPPLGPVIGIAHDGQGVLPTQGIHKATRTETAGTAEKYRGMERCPRKWRGRYIFRTMI